MKIILIILLLFISNCKLNKVVKHHGVQFLDKKHEKLIISKTNKNDIIGLLGYLMKQKIKMIGKGGKSQQKLIRLYLYLS